MSVLSLHRSPDEFIAVARRERCGCLGYLEASTTFSSTSLSPERTYHSQRVPSGSVTQVSVFSA